MQYIDGKCKKIGEYSKLFVWLNLKLLFLAQQFRDET